MIATFYSGLFLLLLADEPADPSALNGIRETLESYLTAIRAVRLQYTERWTENPDMPQIIKEHRAAAAKKGREFLERKIKEGPPEWREEISAQLHRGEPKTVRTYRILDGYPSFRMHVREQNIYTNGEEQESNLELILHNGKLWHIDRTTKGVHHLSTADRSSIPRLPIEAIGLRVSGTANMPLSDLLKFPEVTRIDGEELVHGYRCRILKVGPSLPGPTRPMGWGTNDFMKLWLAVDLMYLPFRIERYIESQDLGKHRLSTPDGGTALFIRHLYELQEYQGTMDPTRGREVPFPRHVTFDDTAGLWEWEINHVELNPVMGPSDFDPAIPSGFAVFQDGKVPSVALSGGSAAYKDRVKETVTDAQRLLVGSKRGDQRDSYIARLRYGLPAFFALAVVLLFLIRRRYRRVHN